MKNSIICQLINYNNTLLHSYQRLGRPTTNNKSTFCNTAVCFVLVGFQVWSKFKWCGKMILWHTNFWNTHFFKISQKSCIFVVFEKLFIFFVSQIFYYNLYSIYIPIYTIYKQFIFLAVMNLPLATQSNICMNNHKQ